MLLYLSYSSSPAWSVCVRGSELIIIFIIWAKQGFITGAVSNVILAERLGFGKVSPYRSDVLCDDPDFL